MPRVTHSHVLCETEYLAFEDLTILYEADEIRRDARRMREVQQLAAADERVERGRDVVRPRWCLFLAQVQREMSA